jgi:class 3 adenylate cyclase
MDIRASTTFMLHVENFDGYIRIMANFIAYVRHAVAEAGGWFDKFTGDGAHLFWTTGSDSLELKLLSRILDVAVGVQKNFIEVTLPAFRVVAGCIPEGFGLAIGIDYGRCLVSTLAHDSNLRVGGKVLPPETGGSVTVLGRAIVGAVRMVSAAGPHEILLNEGPGEFFHRAWRKVDDENSEFVVNRVLVDNKDLQGKQFAYLLGARPIEDALKRHYNPDDTESPK